MALLDQAALLEAQLAMKMVDHKEPHFVISGAFVEDKNTMMRIISLEDIINNTPVKMLNQILATSPEMHKFVTFYSQEYSQSILRPLLNIMCSKPELPISDKLFSKITKRSLRSKMSNETICNDFLRRVYKTVKNSADKENSLVFSTVNVAHDEIMCTMKNDKVTIDLSSETLNSCESPAVPAFDSSQMLQVPHGERSSGIVAVVSCNNNDASLQLSNKFDSGFDSRQVVHSGLPLKRAFDDNDTSVQSSKNFTSSFDSSQMQHSGLPLNANSGIVAARACSEPGMHVSAHLAWMEQHDRSINKQPFGLIPVKCLDPPPPNCLRYHITIETSVDGDLTQKLYRYTEHMQRMNNRKKECLLKCTVPFLVETVAKETQHAHILCDYCLNLEYPATSQGAIEAACMLIFFTRTHNRKCNGWSWYEVKKYLSQMHAHYMFVQAKVSEQIEPIELRYRWKHS